MNRTDLIARVSEMTGIGGAECEKVVNALEKVLQDELGASKGLGGALDKVTGLLNLLRSETK